MVRLIKRYGGGSRKLYDTEESRYVSLDEIAAWVRQGQELRVQDSATGDDVTAQTLAQVIYESHRAGTAMLGVDFLHDAIRRGGKAISRGARQLQTGVDRLVQDGVARLPGARAAKDEVAALRESLRVLEASVARLERAAGGGRATGSAPRVSRGRTGRSR